MWLCWGSYFVCPRTYLRFSCSSPPSSYRPFSRASSTGCTRDHDFGDGPNTVPCDKLKVASVISTMLAAKIEHLFSLGLHDEARFLTAAEHTFLRGLETEVAHLRILSRTLAPPRVQQESPPQSPRKMRDWNDYAPASDALRIKLRWLDEDDHEEEKHSESFLRKIRRQEDFLDRQLHNGSLDCLGDEELVGGSNIAAVYGLLYYATISDDLAAVQEILSRLSHADARQQLSQIYTMRGGIREFIGSGATKSETSGEKRKNVRKRDHKLELAHIAMMWASPAVVTALLSAREEHMGAPFPEIPDSNMDSIGPVMRAAARGRHDNIRAWLDKYPNWDVNRKCDATVTGMATTALGCVFASGGLGQMCETVAVLRKAGATIKNALPEAMGLTALHYACSIPDMTGELLRSLLEYPELRSMIDATVRPTTMRWKFRYGVARRVRFWSCCVRRGSKRGFMVSARRRMLVQLYKCSPLHIASQNGNLDVMFELIRAGATPYQKNGQGETPEQAAGRAWGGVPPVATVCVFALARKLHEEKTLNSAEAMAS